MVTLKKNLVHVFTSMSNHEEGHFYLLKKTNLNQITQKASKYQRIKKKQAHVMNHDLYIRILDFYNSKKILRFTYFCFPCTVISCRAGNP